MRTWSPVSRGIAGAVAVAVVVLGAYLVASGQGSADSESPLASTILNTGIPEAVSLTIFGLSLLGLAIATRRRNQRR